MLGQRNVRVFSNESLYQDGMFSLKRLSLRHDLYGSGCSKTLDRLVFERGDSAAILLYHLSSDSVVLTEQFRAGTYRESSPWCREIVAGVIDQDDTPEQTVIRESMEEVGVSLYQLTSIMSLHPSPGACTEKIHVYLGLINYLPERKVRGMVGEGEDILSLVVPFEQALLDMSSGKMNGAATIIVLQWLSLHKASIQDKISKTK